MAEELPKFCKDCKHQVMTGNIPLAYCWRERKGRQSLVDGEPMMTIKQPCFVERHGPFVPIYVEFCGPQAAFFEPKT